MSMPNMFRDMVASLDAAEQRGYQRGVEEERARIVAWLMALRDMHGDPVGQDFADDIKNGAHHVE